MDKENPWRKDRPGKDVELHLYRSMIGSLMYLTASKPDIMFAVCACARHQVTPKEFARIEAIRLFLAYASFMGFIVYQMDVKSAFLYGTIDKEVYVMQPPRFHDLVYPAKVYKVEKSMYGLHQAPRAWYGTLSKFLLKNGFQRSTIDQTLFIRRSSNTPMDKENPWGKDDPGKDVELHLYRSMIGSLMYLTASRPDIMFAVCACARH
nr:putative ribonuclease H-like domain-containing protein [Tanacetum cinerariifolium]